MGLPALEKTTASHLPYSYGAIHHYALFPLWGRMHFKARHGPLFNTHLNSNANFSKSRHQLILEGHLPCLVSPSAAICLRTNTGLGLCFRRTRGSLRGDKNGLHLSVEFFLLLFCYDLCFPVTFTQENAK